MDRAKNEILLLLTDRWCEVKDEIVNFMRENSFPAGK